VKVIGSMQGFELVILGIDSLGQKAKLEEIAKNSLFNNIFFLDPIPPDQLVSFSDGADIGIIPYRNVGLNTTLASPNKIWEYIASGLFVLTTPFEEVSRLFEDCPCGIAADISNEKDLRKQLELIQSMPDLEHKKQEGKRYFNNELSWEKEEIKLQNLLTSQSNPVC
jgi:glycosyltransferase involved in cell wall biosynthesis